MTAQTWQHVAERVRRRRLDKRMSQAKVAAAAGVSDRTIRLIEQAGQDSYQESTLRAVAQALGWTPNSIELLLEGDEPVEATHAALQPEEFRLAEEVADLKRQLKDALARIDELERR